MKLTKLYGRGAIAMSDDHHEYRPKNGILEVPDHLVNRAKALGFTTYPLPEIEEEAPAAPALTPADGDTPTSDDHTIDATKSDDELLLQFSVEALDSGYTEEGAAESARERLADLRAGGNGHDVALPAPDTPAAPTA